MTPPNVALFSTRSLLPEWVDDFVWEPYTIGVNMLGIAENTSRTEQIIIPNDTVITALSYVTVGGSAGKLDTIYIDDITSGRPWMNRPVLLIGIATGTLANPFSVVPSLIVPDLELPYPKLLRKSSIQSVTIARPYTTMTPFDSDIRLSMHGYRSVRPKNSTK